MTRTDTSALLPLAQTFARQFVRRTRPDGKLFVALATDAPDWMFDAVREAHGTAMPNDWIYTACAHAAEALAETLAYGEDLDDAAHSFADSNADLYTESLVRWLADVPTAWSWCDEAAQDFGVAEDANLCKRIQTGQYLQLRTIFATLRQAVEAQAEAERRF